MKEKHKYYLYKSIRNIALIFLSPLLAIAVLFLLVQVGSDSKTKESIAHASVHGFVTHEQPGEKSVSVITSIPRDNSEMYSYEWEIREHSPTGEYIIDLIGKELTSVDRT